MTEALLSTRQHLGKYLLVETCLQRAFHTETRLFLEKKDHPTVGDCGSVILGEAPKRHTSVC